MKRHPILFNKSNLALYSLIWMLIISIQTFALVELFHFSWNYALVDGFVYGALFYIFGIGLWFFIRFPDINKQNQLSTIIEQLTSLLVMLSLWTLLGIYILEAIHPNNQEVTTFLWSSISWRFMNGLLMYIVLVLFYHLNSNYTHIQEKQKKEMQLERHLKDSEINLLKSKLNPHFLFNSLNSLNALISIDSEKASEMLVELSDYLRFSLHHDYKKMIPFTQEMEHIDQYLSIEKMRFGNKIKLEKEADESSSSAKIPALLLQPLIENAIKYGLQGENQEVNIKISCKMEKEHSSSNISQLQIIIQNNFDNKTAPRKGSGMGLYTVRKRLELLFKQYHLFHIEQKNTTFIVRLIIPQKELL
ncbi:MAG: hypothetical protein B7C24_09460 [Bacteroidetes bacterium 4572_77]|nr:MAG: hypothetical protein B7C24_09460 [Bacteroidetes bacterium 4572_77]